eukprot:3847873-Pyramimonas_sp.AAC.1
MGCRKFRRLTSLWHRGLAKLESRMHASRPPKFEPWINAEDWPNTPSVWAFLSSAQGAPRVPGTTSNKAGSWLAVELSKMEAELHR